MTTESSPSHAATRPALVPILLGAGLLLRLAYSWAASGVPPWTDMAMYDAARLAILEGTKYPVDWPPLYPLFLAAVSRVFGEGYFVLYAAQALLSTLTSYLVYLTAREAFGRRPALLALAVSVVYVDAVWYSSILMAETLALLLLVLCAYLLIRKAPPALAGVVMGLAALTKGVCLISLPPLFVWLVLQERWRRGARAALLFAAAAFAVILPWTARNYREYGRFVLLEPHIGFSLFLGHNPSATGGCDYYFVGTEHGRFYTDPSLSISRKDEIAKKAAIDFILNNPRREAELFLLKLSKYWSFRTHFDMNNGPYPLRKPLYFLSLLTHMVLFPACVLALFFSGEARLRPLSLYVILAYTAAFTLPFSAFGRMRFNLAPFIIMLAAQGLLLLPDLAARLRAGRYLELRWRLFGAAAVSLLLFVNLTYQTLTRLSDVTSRFG